jgi:hypothetical protein
VYQPLAASISMRVMVLPVPVYVHSSAGHQLLLSCCPFAVMSAAWLLLLLLVSGVPADSNATSLPVMKRLEV